MKCPSKAIAANTTLASTANPPISGKKPTYKDYLFENCSESNLDECGKVVFLFGNRGVHLPNNAKQMKPHCKSVYHS